MKLSEFGKIGEISAFAVYGQNESLLVACGKDLYLLFGVKIVSGSVQYSKKIDIITGSSVPSPITSIIPHSTGSRIAILGLKFIQIVSLPLELWINCSVSELLQSKYHCESVFIQENVYMNDAQPIQLIWTNDGDEDNENIFICVLSSDCAIRFYELDGSMGVDYPKVKVDLLSLMPLLSPIHSNRYGLFKSIVSFCIVSCSNRGWNLLLIDSDGDTHVSFVSSSLSQSNTINPLDLPIELNSLHLVPHSSQDIFQSLITLSPKGVVSHLIVMITNGEVDGVRVADSISINGIIGISPVYEGAIVHTSTSLYYIDLTPSYQFIIDLANGEAKEWKGMNVIKCAETLSEMKLISIPSVSINSEDYSSSILIYGTQEGLQSSVIYHQYTSNKSMKTKQDIASTSNESIEDTIKKILSKKNSMINHIGNKSSNEAQLLFALISSIGIVKENVEVISNCIQSTSQCVIKGIGRSDAMQGARSEEGARIISLYKSLADQEERLINSRRTTERLIKRANIVWNALATRSNNSENELEMMKTLKDHSKDIDDMSRIIPKVTLDIELLRREIEKANECSTGLRRRTNITNLREEIESLRKRCEQLERRFIHQ